MAVSVGLKYFCHLAAAIHSPKSVSNSSVTLLDDSSSAIIAPLLGVGG
jgi:hypothetical protein